MKIFGICLVKNEDDIVAETLTKASAWCDHIFVYDTGSSDLTWKIVRLLAETNPKQIVAFRRVDQPFRDELRAEVFGAYRYLAANGDWWCRLDADEIYIDDPKALLMRAPSIYHVVHNLSIQYYFTEKDERAWLEDPERMQQIETEGRMRYYVCNHSEARFFRYRERLTWRTGAWPTHVGLVYPERIRVKHLQYRSPVQIQKRLETRKEAIRGGYKPFGDYDNVTTWREKILSSEGLHYDDGTGHFVINEAQLPRHLERPHIRAAKLMLHGLRIWP